MSRCHDVIPNVRATRANRPPVVGYYLAPGRRAEPSGRRRVRWSCSPRLSFSPAASAWSSRCRDRQYAAGQGVRTETMPYVVQRRIQGGGDEFVERQLQLHRIVLAVEIRDRDTHQGQSPFRDRRTRPSHQVSNRRQQLRSLRGRPRQRVRPGGSGEIVETKPQCHSATTPVGVPHPLRDPIHQARAAPHPVRPACVCRPGRAHVVRRSNVGDDPPAPDADHGCVPTHEGDAQNPCPAGRSASVRPAAATSRPC